jgi:transcriptional regulator with XRE-family HTH domain
MDLKAWREAHGLTQSELARIFGVESVTISRWERGIRKRGAPEGMLELALEALDRRLAERPEGGAGEVHA